MVEGVGFDVEVGYGEIGVVVFVVVEDCDFYVGFGFVVGVYCEIGK